ncbi:MAG: Uma2 family endonuclease [Spirulinaceae cyanobacterium RM2_2_10]|nr:Uma2 family endonuclease [Spirulinaceae cyanobacterium SM2_1_0]NJL01328.1 Uma2 family endonuclease [Spirulinaceae cyanobacterium SM2_1_0]NJO19130.1 Uma2 family endonuclease [Spirulinaceae cyanobacterium RM2_2_10]
MVRAPAQSLSLEEFLQRPETKPASEYLDGSIIQKPMPKGKHSSIQGELTSFINAALRPRQLARAFPELRCTFGGRSLVPDIAVLTWERIPRDADGTVANLVNIAPDWTIEILSPDQRQSRVTQKILACLAGGTQLGWLIDPDDLTILTYAPQQAPQFFDQFDASLPVPAFATELQIQLQDLRDCLFN